MIGKDSLKVIVAELVRQVPLECRDTITLGRLRSPKTRHRGKPVRSARAGGSKRPMIKPIAQSAWTTRRGTVKIVGTVITLPDIDHSTGNHPVADDAYPPVIQCLPLATTIRTL